MILKLQNETFNVYAIKSAYVVDNSLAVLLKDTDTNDTIAVLTVNLHKNLDFTLDEGYAFVDINNCPWAEQFILENKLGSYTYFDSPQGYPLYLFDLEKLHED